MPTSRAAQLRQAGVAGDLFRARRGLRGFVASRAPEVAAPGEIVDQEGKVVGQHEGVTSSPSDNVAGCACAALEARAMCLGVDAAEKRVTIGPREALDQQEIEVEEVAWSGSAPALPLTVAVQIRYRHAGAGPRRADRARPRQGDLRAARTWARARSSRGVLRRRGHARRRIHRQLSRWSFAGARLRLLATA